MSNGVFEVYLFQPVDLAWLSDSGLCVLKYMVDLVSALRAKRKVHTFKTSDGSWQVLVENATHNDVEAAMVRQELREHLREQLKDKEVDQND